MDGAAQEARSRFAAPDSREDTLDHPVAARPLERGRLSDPGAGLFEELLPQGRAGPVEATD